MPRWPTRLPSGSATPDVARTTKAAERVLLPRIMSDSVPMVPGFPGRRKKAAVVTRGRSGSNVTATLLARVLHADTVMRWTDVPGLSTAIRA